MQQLIFTPGFSIKWCILFVFSMLLSCCINVNNHIVQNNHKCFIWTLSMIYCFLICADVRTCTTLQLCHEEGSASSFLKIGRLNQEEWNTWVQNRKTQGTSGTHELLTRSHFPELRSCSSDFSVFTCVMWECGSNMDAKKRSFCTIRDFGRRFLPSTSTEAFSIFSEFWFRLEGVFTSVVNEKTFLKNLFQKFRQQGPNLDSGPERGVKTQDSRQNLICWNLTVF